MENPIKIFESAQFGAIRTAGTSEEPLFCLADICKVLEIRNPRDWKSRLKQDGVVSIYTPTGGGKQQMVYINEQNLYKVIMRSDKPQAEAFQDWVCGEVLPYIRKQGGYIATSSQDSDDDILQRALVIAQRKIAEKEQRNKELQSRNSQLIQANEQQELEIGRLKAPAEYCREVLQSTDTYTFTQIAKDMDMRNVAELMKFLCEHKIVFRQNGQWLPTANCAGKGFFRS